MSFLQIIASYAQSWINPQPQETWRLPDSSVFEETSNSIEKSKEIFSE